MSGVFTMSVYMTSSIGLSKTGGRKGGAMGLQPFPDFRRDAPWDFISCN